MVPVREVDYLEQDPEIRGQNFACISFVSPEDVLLQKDAFLFSRFTRAVGDDVGIMLDNMLAKYGGDPDTAQTVHMIRERHAYLWSAQELQEEYKVFMRLQGEQLGGEFDRENEFRTSVRGFKIRGVYATPEEAASRAQQLKQRDPRFNIYVAQVGCWCPWSPEPDAIKDGEYAETQLNTLMKEYQAGQDRKDEVYTERKRDKLQRIDDETKQWVQRKQRELVAPPGEGGRDDGNMTAPYSEE